jgi:hypothetical protein
MNAAEVHLTLLEAVPELGAFFAFDEVFGNFRQFVVERRDRGDEDLVLRALAYVEDLHRTAPANIAALATERLFKNQGWSSDWIERVGPLTADALASASWSL